MKLFRLAVAGCAASIWLAVNSFSIAYAHDGPEHEIDELTDRIKTEGPSADLLLQRAIEYNVIRKGAEAVKDLERALDFESHSAAILRELARAYFTVGKTNEALDTAARGLKYATEGPEKASLYIARSDFLRARRDHQKALDEMEKAIREHSENSECYLARSLLQQQLGLKKERIKGLAEGIKATGSGLLEAEWIDALIDGGKAEAALERIQAELKDSRLRSSWLIRRAKVLFAMQKDDEAKADAKEALEELNQRLSRGTSDALLLADRSARKKRPKKISSRLATKAWPMNGCANASAPWVAATGEAAEASGPRPIRTLKPTRKTKAIRLRTKPTIRRTIKRSSLGTASVRFSPQAGVNSAPVVASAYVNPQQL